MPLTKAHRGFLCDIFRLPTILQLIGAIQIYSKIIGSAISAIQQPFAHVQTRGYLESIAQLKAKS